MSTNCGCAIGIHRSVCAQKLLDMKAEQPQRSSSSIFVPWGKRSSPELYFMKANGLAQCYALRVVHADIGSDFQSVKVSSTDYFSISCWQAETVKTEWCHRKYSVDIMNNYYYEYEHRPGPPHHHGCRVLVLLWDFDSVHKKTGLLLRAQY